MKRRNGRCFIADYKALFLGIRELNFQIIIKGFSKRYGIVYSTS